MSVEVHEMEFPFLAEFSELRTDSGGAGRSRGGLGVRRGWRMLRGEGTVTDMAEPSLTPYYGLFGAHGGAPNTTVIGREGQTLAPATKSGKVVRFPIRQGDLVQILKWGAGGYGDPLERDPALVREDVREGYVSAVWADALYGVVVRDGEVDAAATRERRKALSAARAHLEVVAGPPDAAPNEARTWTIAPATAQRLGAAEGDLLECLTSATPALRGRARVAGGQRQDAVPLGPFALTALGVSPGDRVWIRKAFNPMEHELGGRP
jgi:N-methylhydantoinase B